MAKKKRKKIQQIGQVVDNTKVNGKSFEEEVEVSKINWLFHLKVVSGITIVVIILFFSVKWFISHKAMQEVDRGIILYENALRMQAIDTMPILLDNYPESYAYIIEAKNIIVNTREKLNELFVTATWSEEDFIYLEENFLNNMESFQEKLKIARTKPANDTFIIFYDGAIDLTEEILDIYGKAIKRDPRNQQVVVGVARRNYRLLTNLFRHCEYLLGTLSYPLSIEAALDLFHRAIVIDNRSAPGFYYAGKTYQISDWKELAGRYLARAYYFDRRGKYGQKVYNEFKTTLSEVKSEFEALNTEITDIFSDEYLRFIRENSGIVNRLKDAYYNYGMLYYFDRNDDVARELLQNVVNLDPQLESFIAFMAEKRINSLGKRYLEIDYDPRW